MNRKRITNKSIQIQIPFRSVPRIPTSRDLSRYSRGGLRYIGGSSFIITMLPMLLCLGMYWGCASAVTRVPIKIQVESTIDVTKYSGFAVLPFIEAKDSGRQRIVSSDDTGEEIASLMRIGLGRNQNLDVVSTQDTLRLFTDETADEDLLVDASELVRIGEYFEVDAVIVGSYDFFAVSQPRRYYGERYSRSLQRYVTDYQDYLEKTYILSLRVVIASVDTEEIIQDDTYERRAFQAHSVSSFLISEVAPHQGVLKNLARQAISEFTRQVSPHYEQEERFLVR